MNLEGKQYQLKIIGEKIMKFFEDAKKMNFDWFTFIESQSSISEQLENMITANIDNILLVSSFIEKEYSSFQQRIKKNDFESKQIEVSYLIKKTQILGMYYNAFFIFIRSLQDNFLRMFFELKKQKWGVGTSMIRKGELNQEFLSILPDLKKYEKWFFEMRELRNNIKYGACSQGGGYDQDVKISVSFLAIQKGRMISSYDLEVEIDELERAIDNSNTCLESLLKQINK